MGAPRLLPSIEQGQPLLKIEEGRPVQPCDVTGDDKRRPGPVVVFQKAQLYEIVRISDLLAADGLGIPFQGDPSQQVVLEYIVDVVVIAGVERLVAFRVGQHGKPLGPALPDKRRLHRFRQPEAARAHLLHLRPGLQPELQRHQGGHVAPEAVHHGRPVFQRLNLVLPQSAVGVVQIHHVPPVAHPVAQAAVRLVVKPFRVLLCQHGIGGGVVVHHVDDALHPQLVDIVRQPPELLQRAVLRVHRPVVPDGVGAAQRALPVYLPDGVDGHQPDNVRPQPLDPPQILADLLKRPFSAVVAHKNGVHHLAPVPFIRIACHMDSPFLFHIRGYPGAENPRPGALERSIPQTAPGHNLVFRGGRKKLGAGACQGERSYAIMLRNGPSSWNLQRNGAPAPGGQTHEKTVQHIPCRRGPGRTARRARLRRPLRRGAVRLCRRGGLCAGHLFRRLC